MDSSVITTVVISIITAFISGWSTFLWMKFEVNRLKEEVKDIKDRLHALETIVNTIMTSNAIFNEKFINIEKAIVKLENTITNFTDRMETSIESLLNKFIRTWK